MQDAPLVRIRHRPRYAADRAREEAEVGPSLSRPISDRESARDEMHREIMLRLAFSDFVNGHDVWMVQIRGGMGFVLKKPERFFSSQLAGKDHLHRHLALQADLPRPIDHSHPAPRDFRP